MKCRVLPKEFWIPTGMCLGLFLVYLTDMYSIHTCVLAWVEACQAPRPENIGRKLDTLNFTNMAKTGRGELWAQINGGGGAVGGTKTLNNFNVLKKYDSDALNFNKS